MCAATGLRLGAARAVVRQSRAGTTRDSLTSSCRRLRWLVARCGMSDRSSMGKRPSDGVRSSAHVAKQVPVRWQRSRLAVRGLGEEYAAWAPPRASRGARRPDRACASPLRAGLARAEQRARRTSRQPVRSDPSRGAPTARIGARSVVGSRPVRCAPGPGSSGWQGARPRRTDRSASRARRAPPSRRFPTAHARVTSLPWTTAVAVMRSRPGAQSCWARAYASRCAVRPPFACSAAMSAEAAQMASDRWPSTRRRAVVEALQERV